MTRTTGRGSRRRDDDEDDDRPRSRRGRDADDDERPRSRRRRDDDEDEERPVSRRGRVDDDDDRPRSRRDPDEDEDDERPRGRKARVTARDDGDDDGDTRERRRRRNGRSKKNKRLLIGLIIGVAAFLFWRVGAVLYFAGILGGGASSDMLAWAPADSQSIMYVDVEAADKVDELRNELKADALHMGKHGIKREDVSAVLGAGRISGMGGEPDVMVIKLRASADKNAIINSVGGTKATAGDKEYYKTRAGGALYFPSDRMVVISKNERAVTGRLGKDEGKVVITDDLRDVASRGDGIVWIASTGQAAEQADFIGMISAIANMGAMFGPGGKGFGPGGPDFPKPSRAKSTAMSMKVSGNTASVRFESTYDNADAAQKIADDLRPQHRCDQEQGRARHRSERLLQRSHGDAANERTSQERQGDDALRNVVRMDDLMVVPVFLSATLARRDSSCHGSHRAAIGLPAPP